MTSGRNKKKKKPRSSGTIAHNLVHSKLNSLETSSPKSGNSEPSTPKSKAQACIIAGIFFLIFGYLLFWLELKLVLAIITSGILFFAFSLWLYKGTTSISKLASYFFTIVVAIVLAFMGNSPKVKRADISPINESGLIMDISNPVDSLVFPPKDTARLVEIIVNGNKLIIKTDMPIRLQSHSQQNSVNPVVLHDEMFYKLAMLQNEDPAALISYYDGVITDFQKDSIHFEVSHNSDYEMYWPYSFDNSYIYYGNNHSFNLYNFDVYKDYHDDYVGYALEAYLLKGLLYEKYGYYEQAINSYDGANQIRSGAVGNAQYGKVYFESGNHKMANIYLDKAIEVVEFGKTKESKHNLPDFFQMVKYSNDVYEERAYFIKGRLCFAEGLYDDAIKYFRKYCDISNHYLEAEENNWFGIALAATGNNRDAIEAFSKAIDDELEWINFIKENYPDDIKWINDRYKNAVPYFYNRASLYLSIGDIKHAKEDYDIVLRYSGNNLEKFKLKL